MCEPSSHRIAGNSLIGGSVRFLDNFRAGTRGATSAEYFLKAGYAVIFMHRQHSLQPFSRHFSHTTNPFLDFLEINDEVGPDSEFCIRAKPEAREQLLSVLRAYRDVQRAGTLLTINFVTVNDYLFLLRALSEQMACLHRKAMFYLAAAVSDFFLPRQKMSEHKIQSGKGSLQIEMDQVPKILKPLKDNWASEAFIVLQGLRCVSCESVTDPSQLETDPALLIPKARAALERYGHRVVIGNDLNRRKFEVVFVEPNDNEPGTYKETWVRLPEGKTEIEEEMIEKLVEMHADWIKKGTK